MAIVKGNEAEKEAERTAQPNKKGRFTGISFVVLAIAFALSVAIQVFLAGMSVFMNPIHWSKHVSFVHIFEYLPLLMLMFGFVGRLQAKLLWQSAVCFALIIVMYFTANVISVAPVAAAFHPVAALVLFGLAVLIVPRAWRTVFGGKEASV
ncbi:DUF6220 domain-containing protein [Paenibacillus contaminans]|uniref:Uncharacterized protein n=1 Tax=Paenibacillus contaminans TaxID=450362 RepID=A0A329MM69_9BACL|nr:DUF6220 domain-containing protein [Paenibacillus contaminans]RAV20700.1 hypothetical protein DQG23_14425 [Paenibacillus contaminans]